MAYIVYLGKSNEISIVLESRNANGDWTPLLMESVTDISLDFGSTVISSTTSPAAISWALTSIPLYDDDVYVITLMLGNSGLSVGRYVAHLIVTDPNYPNGLVWATLPIQVSDLSN